MRVILIFIQNFPKTFTESIKGFRYMYIRNLGYIYIYLTVVRFILKLYDSNNKNVYIHYIEKHIYMYKTIFISTPTSWGKIYFCFGSVLSLSLLDFLWFVKDEKQKYIKWSISNLFYNSQRKVLFSWQYLTDLFTFYGYFKSFWNACNLYTRGCNKI